MINKNHKYKRWIAIIVALTLMATFLKTTLPTDEEFARSCMPSPPAGGVCDGYFMTSLAIATTGAATLILSPSILFYLRTKKKPLSNNISALLYALILLPILGIYFTGLRLN